MKSIPYGCQFIGEEDIQAVIETLQSDFMTQGPKVSEFEQAVAKYHDCKYGVAFSNGTAALHGAYVVSGLKDGGKFLTSPITFVATANAGVYVGGIPDFVDICSDSYNMDLEKLKQKFTSEYKVVTPVSFAGYPVDIMKVREIVGKDCFIIHDAAHAIGAKIQERSIVEGSDATILSFHPVKHIACGEGGMVLTNREDIYDALLQFRSHGITKNPNQMQKVEGPWYYEMQTLGFNYRLTDLQSALGISQLKKLNESLYRRNQIAKKYIELLKDETWLQLPKPISQLDWLDNAEYMNLKHVPSDLHAYHLFPIQVKNKNMRKALFEYLIAENIHVQVHYIPVYQLPFYQKEFLISADEYPVAQAFYEREISLPMFPTLTEEQQNYIVYKIKQFQFHK